MRARKYTNDELLFLKKLKGRLNRMKLVKRTRNSVIRWSSPFDKKNGKYAYHHTVISKFGRGTEISIILRRQSDEKMIEFSCPHEIRIQATNFAVYQGNKTGFDKTVNHDDIGTDMYNLFIEIFFKAWTKAIDEFQPRGLSYKPRVLKSIIKDLEKI